MPSPGVASAETPTAYDGVERELNDDAAWKRIQQNTFTRWANEHLKKVNLRMSNLSTDLSDGLLLIRLIEVLSQKRLGKYNTKPNLRAQKLENVSMALMFLETEEGVRLVNIDSSAIVDSKLKLILGLIWTLILHYSISLPMYDEAKAEEVKEAAGKQNGTAKATPKQKLMGWIQDKVPAMQVKNFTSDWQNGRALGALVDSVAPGLCPYWEDWQPQHALQNTAETMDKADQWLGVPKLIEPQEFINPEVDERSMMTYLSQYPHAKLRAGAPLEPWAEKSNIFAHGPGVQPSGLIAGQPTEFCVDVSGANTTGPLEVAIEHTASGKREPLEIQYSDVSKSFFVAYSPQAQGTYVIRIAYAGREIPKSPITVLVADAKKEAFKVFATGPGLESGVRAGKQTTFDVHVPGGSQGRVEVAILDAAGKQDTASVELHPVSDGVYQCSYVAQKPGLHSVNIFYDGDGIAGSPFGVKVSPEFDSKAVRAVGRGLQPKGVRVGDAADFYVYTDKAGDGGTVDVIVYGPAGTQVPILEAKQVSPTKYYYRYEAQQPGRYDVSVSYGDAPIAQSPFPVQIGPSSSSKIRAYGPGLEGGIVNSPCTFTVETNGEAGSLGFAIEGPSEAQIHCHDNEDGSAEVSYVPTVPGDYAIHILCNGENIPSSPFLSHVAPFEDVVRPDLVHCYGPGLQSNGVEKNHLAEFVVDASKAGPGVTKIWAIDRNYDFVDIKVVEQGNQVYACSYLPKKAIRHTVVVSHAGVTAPGSPYRVFVQEGSDPSKVSVYGPGVEPGVRSLHPTHFMIDCKQAGAGEIEVSLNDDKGSKVDIDVLENSDGTFTVKYTAPRPGTYQLRVVFAGAEIPGSPIRVNVQPHLDLGGVRVEGLDDTVFVGALTSFVVDFQSPDRSEETNSDQLSCVLTAPSQTATKCNVKRVKPDVYSVSYFPQEEGEHTLDMTYDSIPLHQFPIRAVKGNDPSKCKARGEGLAHGYVGFPCEFVVETKGAGPGTVNVTLEGPSKACIESHDAEDGARRISYIPSEPGEYSLSIRFADVNIPGSPFLVTVDYPVDASKVSASGPGLEQSNCRANAPLQFNVDASKSGFAPLNVVVLSDNRDVSPLPEVRERSSNVYDITYYPSAAGTTCTVHITYGGTDIPNSPYRMQVLPTSEADKVRLVAGEDVVPLGEIPASLPYTFTIDTRNAGYANLEVSVLDPDKQPIPVDVIDKGDGVYDVTLIPHDAGPYNVVIKYGGEEISASPYNVVAQPVGDASKCFIADGFRERVAVNEQYSITVNAAEAGGPGAVTCRVQPLTTAPSSCSVNVQDNKDGTFSIFYTLKGYGTYAITVKFGGQPVPRGVWNVEAVPAEQLTSFEGPVIHSLRYEGDYADSVSSLSPIDLVLPGALLRDLAVEVITPTQKIDYPSLRDNRDGTISIRYSPREAGLHEMRIRHNGDHVQGSPLQFFVHGLEDAAVTASGQGLVHGVAGRPSSFTVAVKDNVPAGLAVYIEGPSKADLKCQDNYDGTCTVNWLPMAGGVYKIHVKYDDKEIGGSPFTAKVIESSSESAHITLGSPSEVSLEITEAGDGRLAATVTSPAGADVPCTVRPLDNAHLGLSFTPRETGEYLAYVKRDDAPLPNSPFCILVNEAEIGKPEKLKLRGRGLVEAVTQEYNEFTVDTWEAGNGSLVISIEGPSKCEIDCVSNKDGTSTVLYRPTEPGVYVISVKFVGHHVTGSPFTVKCQGPGSGVVSEQVQQMRTAAHQATPGNQCELCIKIPGTEVGNLSGSLMSPNGMSEDVEVVEVSEQLYAVRFIPRDVGLHTVSVLHKGEHISGSPFLFTVGTIKDGGGAHKVRAVGQGLHQGTVNHPQTFNIYTREAGPGNLSVTIEGPSKAKIDFKDHKDDNCYITYSVSKPGDYKIAIKFDEVHIPDSPFKASITAATDEAAKMEVVPLQSHILPVNKSAVVTALTHGAKGYLDAKVTAPSGVTDDCFITPSADGDSYFVTFVPQELGYHYVHLKLDGIALASSPLRVSVIDRDAASGADGPPQSSRVTCDGSGLKKAYVGRKNAFTVDCSEAGGSRRLLFAAVMTPSGPSDDVYIKYTGGGKYVVEYSVHDKGACFVHVKYGDEDVPGSPFPVTV